MCSTIKVIEWEASLVAMKPYAAINNASHYIIEACIRVDGMTKTSHRKSNDDDDQ